MNESKSFEVSIALQTDKPIKEYGRLGKLVELLGFDVISVYNDMLFQPAWLPLMQIAQYTNKIRLGPAAVNPFTSHPINIAGNIALLDEISRGRVYLGLARGSWLDFVGLIPRNPISSLKEAFECITHLLSQSHKPYKGKIYPTIGGDSLRWKLLRKHIPMLLGTWGPKMVHACINYVSEIKIGGTANPGVVHWMRNLITTATENNSENATKVRIVIGAVSVVDYDGEKARELAKKEVALYLPVVAKLDPTLSIDSEILLGIEKASSNYNYEEAAQYIDDQLLEKFAFAGTPEEILAHSLQLLNRGAHRIEFGTPHGLNSEEGIKLLGNEVLPVLREY